MNNGRYTAGHVATNKSRYFAKLIAGPERWCEWCGETLSADQSIFCNDQCHEEFRADVELKARERASASVAQPAPEASHEARPLERKTQRWGLIAPPPFSVVRK